MKTKPNPTISPSKVKPPDNVPVRRRSTALILSPLAYLELSFYCHDAETEVAAMGISSPDDPLYIDRVVLLKQTASACFVELDDDAVADHVESHAEQGIAPSRCGRVWMHTHPGKSASPSNTDESTFARAFGGCDWSVMFILARGGEMYARLQFAAIAGVQVELPVKIDWSTWPELANQLVYSRDVGTWRQDLERLVTPEPELIHRGMMLDDADRSWGASFADLEAEYDLARELLDERAASDAEEVRYGD